MTPSARYFTFLLRLLPASFRARHGRELHALTITWDLFFQVGRAWAIAIGGGLDAGRASLFDAVSGLRRNPGSTLISVGTLALGIGATAASFSVLDGVLLKPGERHSPLDRLGDEPLPS